MKLIQLLIASLLLTFGLTLPSLSQSSERYPTEQELQSLVRQYKQQLEKQRKIKDPNDRRFTVFQRTPDEKQRMKVFVQSWSKVDPSVASFLGVWSEDPEQYIEIYPSKTKGQVCILGGDETGLSSVVYLGKVVNRRYLKVSDKTFLFRQDDLLGSAYVIKGKPTLGYYSGSPRILTNPSKLIVLNGNLDGNVNKKLTNSLVRQFEQNGCTDKLH
jgi:hypothetical protein